MSAINGNILSKILVGVLLLILIVLFIYASAVRKRARKLRHSIHHDAVTGGLNLTGFRNASNKHFKNNASQYAVIAMELVNYQQIQHTFGLSGAQEVLTEVYTKLCSVLSSAEPAARHDNGRFCFLLKNHQENLVMARLQRILSAINSGTDIYTFKLRFGICLPIENSTFDDMLANAFFALETGDQDREENFYHLIANDQAKSKWDLVKQMERSIAAEDFYLYLQPRVHLADNRVSSAEATLRWRHPTRGMLTPEMFIPVLEEYHVSTKLEDVLLNKVVLQIAEWKKKNLEPCNISLHLSGDAISVDRFTEFSRVCKSYGIEPDLVEFSLSDKLLYKSSDMLSQYAELIHEFGFRCALDNFGDTIMPVDLLREVNVDTIKFSRELFEIKNNNNRNRFVIEALIKIATQMRIRTIADGIDNASQARYLQQAACDMIQGRCCSLPLSPDEFNKLAYLNGELCCISLQESSSAQDVQFTDSADHSDNIIMFSYIPAQDKIVFSSCFSPLLAGKRTITNAMSMFRHSELIHENDHKDFFRMIERCEKENGWIDNSIRFYTAKGHYEWLEVHMRMDATYSRESIISGTMVNVSSWKNEVNRWKEKATRDALTGVFNREYFERSVAKLLDEGTVASAGIVFIDVDDFKQVNDTLGHMVGDDVLCYVSKRLLSVFRHTDIIARYGGDEFVAFVKGITKPDLENRLTQLRDSFRFPYRNNALEYHISTSIGAAIYPEDGITYKTLLDRADTALYAAKERGKNGFVLYDSALEN